MLNLSKDGQSLFLTFRDHRSTWRKNDLSYRGEEGLKARAVQSLALEAELSSLQEQVEFMRSEGMLSAEQEEAATNCIGWGKVLLNTIPEEQR